MLNFGKIPRRPWTIKEIRNEIIGRDQLLLTPFGRRLLLYADYTASGRCLNFIETYLQYLSEFYANTHTEDDVTGRITSELLHQAENLIKTAVNAGVSGRLVACGSGTTAAIQKLQQILGVAISSATRHRLEPLVKNMNQTNLPVVFIGPYEHHSNEVTWRNTLVTPVRIGIDAQGHPNLDELEHLLQKQEYKNRLKIGAFSAASNVTGTKSDVYKIATLLHKYDALACFDYAASGPYVDIDMNPASRQVDDDPSIDAIFLSPHKFLGGPGSSGILVFNERIYPKHLPPSICGGGTVDYVGINTEDFIVDIEQREKAGTPGILQTIKAGLAFNLKQQVTTKRIHEAEQRYLRQAMDTFFKEPNIEILGHSDLSRRLAIISFNLKAANGKYIHHRLVSTLLDDLFGIQSRAGCSCAGPYGHNLLNIDEKTSDKYRQAIQDGYMGLKPGWCRLSLHWTMDELDIDYIIQAVVFLSRYATRFVNLYNFDVKTGTWKFKDHKPTYLNLSIEEAWTQSYQKTSKIPSRSKRGKLYKNYIKEAQTLAVKLGQNTAGQAKLNNEVLESLRFFVIPCGSS